MSIQDKTVEALTRYHVLLDQSLRSFQEEHGEIKELVIEQDGTRRLDGFILKNCSGCGGLNIVFSFEIIPVPGKPGSVKIQETKLPPMWTCEKCKAAYES